MRNQSKSTNTNLTDIQWTVQFQVTFKIALDVFENEVDILPVAAWLFAEHFFQSRQNRSIDRSNHPFRAFKIYLIKLSLSTLPTRFSRAASRMTDAGKPSRVRMMLIFFIATVSLVVTFRLRKTHLTWENRDAFSQSLEADLPISTLSDDLTQFVRLGLDKKHFGHRCSGHTHGQLYWRKLRSDCNERENGVEMNFDWTKQKWRCIDGCICWICTPATMNRIGKHNDVCRGERFLLSPHPSFVQKRIHRYRYACCMNK